MSYNPIHTKKELEQMKKDQAKQAPPAAPHKPEEHPVGHSPIHTKQEVEQLKHEQAKHEPTPPVFKQPEIKISDAEYSTFIGLNDDDYLSPFKQFEINGDKFIRTWNMGAFIGGPWWLLYRKMHMWAAIYFVLTLPFFLFVPILGLIPMAGLGMTGNYIYYKYTKKKIMEQKLMHPVRDITLELKEIGGIYKWGIAVGLVGTMLLLWIIMTLLLVMPGLSIFNGGGK